MLLLLIVPVMRARRFLKEAGCGARRHSIGDEASPLWEWLRATIIAARCRSQREKITFIGTF
jgi:hypothetical protein